MHPCVSDVCALCLTAAMVRSALLVAVMKNSISSIVHCFLKRTVQIRLRLKPLASCRSQASREFDASEAWLAVLGCTSSIEAAAFIRSFAVGRLDGAEGTAQICAKCCAGSECPSIGCEHRPEPPVEGTARTRFELLRS